MAGEVKYKLERWCDSGKMREIAKDKGLTPMEIDLLDCKFCKAYSDARLQATFHYLGSRTSIWRAWTKAKEKLETT